MIIQRQTIKIEKCFQLLFCLFLLSACASNEIIRDHGYSKSLQQYQKGEFNTAIDEFPDGEDNGFITTLEQSWLGLANNDKVSAKRLISQSRFFEDRKVTHLSKAARTFVLAETEEEYLPSEHEVVAHHLVSSMILLKNKDYKEARVEALRASLTLQNNFDQDNPGFDDPALRVWAASLWIALGEWDKAQVDLRVAKRLSPALNLSWLEEKTPPKEMHIAFFGSGPSLTYKASYPPEFTFHNSPNLEASLLDSSLTPIPMSLLTTEKWYQWQHDRNTTLKYLAEKSNYMTHFTGLKALAYSSRTIGFLAAHSVSVVGAALGASVFVGGSVLGMALHIESGDYYAFMGVLGLNLTEFFYKRATDINADIQAEISDDESKNLSQIQTYRFVRFLPSQIGVYGSYSDSSKAVTLQDQRRAAPQLELTQENGPSKVLFYWMP